MKKLILASALLLSGFVTFGAGIGQATEATADVATSLTSAYTGVVESEVVAPNCQWVLIGGVWYYICT